VTSETNFPGKNRRTTALIAIVALFAVIIAPWCAPLCFAKSCAAGAAEAEGCHSSAAQYDYDNDEPQSSLNTSKSCRAGEILAVLRSPDKQEQSSSVTRSTPAPLHFVSASSPLTVATSTNWLRRREKHNSFRPPENFLLTTNLRI
jgi:hypothetical protein